MRYVSSHHHMTLMEFIIHVNKKEIGNTIITCNSFYFYSKLFLICTFYVCLDEMRYWKCENLSIYTPINSKKNTDAQMDEFLNQTTRT